MTDPTPPRASDRNLLFGILALQMDFIKQEALIAAMKHWVFDKAKPLGRILMDQGAMRSDQFELLEALVRKHLELHEDDPEKSLAALSSLGSARKHLEQIADAEVQVSLAHVAIAGRIEENDPFATRFRAGEDKDSCRRNPQYRNSRTSILHRAARRRPFLRRCAR